MNSKYRAGRWYRHEDGNWLLYLGVGQYRGSPLATGIFFADLATVYQCASWPSTLDGDWRDATKCEHDVGRDVARRENIVLVGV
jgi:hypothetical protein